MDKQSMEDRLAAHAVEPVDEAVEPDEPEQDGEVKPPDEPPEALVKSVGDVIRLAGGSDSRVIVELLKKVGALAEDGSELVYTLHKPLGPPVAGVDKYKGVKKVKFAAVLTGYHRRRMAQPHEGPENAVLLTWVEALTHQSRDFVDRLSAIDTDACMAIAHYIEGASKNG
jgi:hypothetical protein